MKHLVTDRRFEEVEPTSQVVTGITKPLEKALQSVRAVCAQSDANRGNHGPYCNPAASD
jgi:hypothetical protein